MYELTKVFDLLSMPKEIQLAVGNIYHSNTNTHVSWYLPQDAAHRTEEGEVFGDEDERQVTDWLLEHGAEYGDRVLLASCRG